MNIIEINVKNNNKVSCNYYKQNAIAGAKQFYFFMDEVRELLQDETKLNKIELKILKEFYKFQCYKNAFKNNKSYDFRIVSELEVNNETTI